MSMIPVILYLSTINSKPLISFIRAGIIEKKQCRNLSTDYITVLFHVYHTKPLGKVYTRVKKLVIFSAL